MSKPTIKLGNITVPYGLSQKDLLKFLVENKELLMAEKKSVTKEADGIPHIIEFSRKYFIDKEGKLQKATNLNPVAVTEPKGVLCVINTTNFMDSHSDVHLPGIWNKSIKDNEVFLHLQEHKMMFTNIISDESKAYTQKMTWKELGFNMAGTTEALIFDTTFTGRNPYMEDQYKKGFVKNHSVAMQYVSLKLCINEPEDEYYKEEYANWVQYAPLVVNIADAEKQGYFWAVPEAKIIEGSAVPKGSNIITPTVGFKSAEPPVGTQTKQPDPSTVVTDEVPKGVNYDKLSTVKFF